MSVTSAGNLKEQEQNRFASLFNVSPRGGGGGGLKYRVDLNDLLTSNEKLFSLPVHNTNVVSGPVIESALIKQRSKIKPY